jgi:hypothetical protein
MDLWIFLTMNNAFSNKNSVLIKVAIFDYPRKDWIVIVLSVLLRYIVKYTVIPCNFVVAMHEKKTLNRKNMELVVSRLYFSYLPAFMLSPSMMAASISTWPIIVSLEPRPALKAASSSITETAATTASKTLPELQFFRFFLNKHLVFLCVLIKYLDKYALLFVTLQ